MFLCGGSDWRSPLIRCRFFSTGAKRRERSKPGNLPLQSVAALFDVRVPNLQRQCPTSAPLQKPFIACIINMSLFPHLHTTTPSPRPSPALSLIGLVVPVDVKGLVKAPCNHVDLLITCKQQVAVVRQTDRHSVPCFPALFLHGARMPYDSA